MSERTQSDSRLAPKHAGREGQFLKHVVHVMAAVGVAASFASACFPLARATPQAREIGQTSVGRLRRDLSQLSEREAADKWTFFAAGAAEDHRSLGCICEQGYSIPELVAFMQYTARDNQMLSEALSDFWANRHCSLQTQKDAETVETYKKGWKEAWESAGRLLLAIRQSEDIALLQSLIRDAEGNEADPIAQAKEVVARARVSEMTRRGIRPQYKPHSVKPLK